MKHLGKKEVRCYFSKERDRCIGFCAVCVPSIDDDGMLWLSTITFSWIHGGSCLNMETTLFVSFLKSKLPGNGTVRLRCYSVEYIL